MGWSQQTNIRGPQGEPGPGIVFRGTVPTAADLPANAQQGDMYTTIDDGHMWVWDGTQWIDGGSSRGADGAPGPPNVLGIGTVVTVAPGGAATSSITGTSPAQTLNLGIPRGDVGAKGDKGDKGDQGIQGIQGIQGPTGAQGATGANITAGTALPVSAVDGALFWHTTEKTLYVRVAGVWEPVVGTWA